MAFEKGQSGNPAGRPSGRAAFVDRATKYLEGHTVEELMALVNDRDRFAKLSVYDGIVLRSVAAALTKGGVATDRLLDRIIGKTPIAIETKQVDSYAALVAAAGEMERKERIINDVDATHSSVEKPGFFC